MKVNFEVRSDKTKEAKEAKDLGLKQALFICGEVMERHAKEQLYPGHGKVTGNLQNSITHDADESAVIVGTNVKYAPYIELGSSVRRGGGYHYLKNAVMEHLDEYRKIIENSLK